MEICSLDSYYAIQSLVSDESFEEIFCSSIKGGTLEIGLSCAMVLLEEGSHLLGEDLAKFYSPLIV